MKPEELMIGDWVYNTHNGKPERVEEIGSGLVMLDYNDLYEYDEIEPIPLTAEILRDNGFREDRKDTMFRLLATHSDAVGYMAIHFNAVSGQTTSIVVEHSTENMEIRRVNIGGCAYVHELQHALRLCKFDKEIEL